MAKKKMRETIEGRILFYGENTKAYHVETVEGLEVIVHTNRQLDIGDYVVIEPERVLKLTKTTWSIWANHIDVMSEEKEDYFTLSEIQAITQRYEKLIAAGFDEKQAWDLSYEVIY